MDHGCVNLPRSSTEYGIILPDSIISDNSLIYNNPAIILMPTATSLQGWAFSNYGPLTTTFTTPAACPTTPGDLQYLYAQLVTEVNNITTTLLVAGQCDYSHTTLGFCYPSGAAFDKAYSTNLTDNPAWGSTVEYFSPGLACPSGWTTAVRRPCQQGVRRHHHQLWFCFRSDQHRDEFKPPKLTRKPCW